MQKGKQVRQTGEKILLVREALAVPLVALGLHKTTWLTKHYVKPAGCGSYAIMERWCMMDGNAALLTKAEHCEERMLLSSADSILSPIYWRTILCSVPAGAIGYLQYEVKFSVTVASTLFHRNKTCDVWTQKRVFSLHNESQTSSRTHRTSVEYSDIYLFHSLAHREKQCAKASMC